MMKWPENPRMKNKSRNLLFLFFVLLVSIAKATDLEQVVSGGDVEDLLGKMKNPTETNPYLVTTPDNNDVEKNELPKQAPEDFIFKTDHETVSVKNAERKNLDDFGYAQPSSMGQSDVYLEINKKSMARDFRKHSSGALNMAYIQNHFAYDSANDIINRTISQGYKHVKGGAIYIRNDQYFLRRDFLNTYWSLGGGIGYNSGRGIFVGGEQSDATFRLWEIPVDAGLGLEIPIYHWFKIAGTVGPSATILYQNRSDFQNGEKGKNKTQVSYGQFANAQFKINIGGFNDNAAYEMFTESRITNLLLNLEIRYQNYQNFQDAIKISGTSVGLGFTFEYL